MKATKKMAYAAMATIIGCTSSNAHAAELAAREDMAKEFGHLYDVGVEYTWDPSDGMLA